MRTFQPHYARNIPHLYPYFLEYFLTMGRQKVVCSTRITQEPGPMAILNKLLSDSEYSLFCLDRLPYCKTLYQIAILNPEFGDKLEVLALEKQIRVRNN